MVAENADADMRGQSLEAAERGWSTHAYANHIREMRWLLGRDEHRPIPPRHRLLYPSFTSRVYYCTLLRDDHAYLFAPSFLSVARNVVRLQGGLN